VDDVVGRSARRPGEVLVLIVTRALGSLSSSPISVHVIVG
jgi:hypothetical protein